MAGHHIGVVALICSLLLVLPSWSESNQSNDDDNKPILPSLRRNNSTMVNNAQRPIIEEHKKGRQRNDGKPHGKTKKRNKKIKNLNKKEKLEKKNKYKNNSTRVGTGGYSDRKKCSFINPCQEYQGYCFFDYECAGALTCGRKKCRNGQSNCCINDFLACGVGVETRKRIIGGSETFENQYPWMVRLPWGCGGALITDRHILTARHCLCWRRHHSNNDYDCKVNGNCDCIKNGRWVPTMSEATYHWKWEMVKLSVHNQYDATDYVEYHIKEVKWPRGNNHDFAMIILDIPANLPDLTIGTVCLPSRANMEYTGKDVVAMGWGDTESSSDQSPVLMHIRVKVSQNQYSSNWLYTDTKNPMNEHASICHGDSGGPLVHFNRYSRRWTIIGTLYGYYGKNCLTATENIWNTITAHYDWIKNNI